MFESDFYFHHAAEFPHPLPMRFSAPGEVDDRASLPETDEVDFLLIPFRPEVTRAAVAAALSTAFLTRE